MQDKPTLMLNTKCNNCSHALEITYNYCPNCSQKANLHAFDLKHIFHEFFHAFTHTDKGVLFLIKELALRPGVVVKEYVLEGKRKKYFNPFTFLLLVLGFTIFINSMVHPFTKVVPTKNYAYLTETEKKKSEKLMEKQLKVNAFFEKKTNIVTLLSAPIFALVFWIAYRKSGINYAEHLVTYIILSGFITLLSALTFVPLSAFLKNTPWYYFVLLINLFTQLLYFSWAYRTVLQVNTTSKNIKVHFVTFMSIVAWTIFSIGAVMIYFLLP